MTTLCISKGRVIDPASGLDAQRDILIEGGKITSIGEGGELPPETTIIDAQGCIVAPGFLDLHVHLRDPGQEYKEDIASGSRAAAAGGFTTILCMPNTDPVNDSASVTEYIQEEAKRVGLVDVRPVGAITKGLAGTALSDIGDMAAAGVSALSDDGHPVMDAGMMRRAMEYAKGFGLPIISHCEDTSLSSGGVMHEGHVSMELGLIGIPACAEEAMVARDIMLAELTRTHLHIAHVSTEGSVRLIRQAKERGIPVTAEVTPHHLFLTEEAVTDFDPNTKVNPPLRREVDRQAVIEALADGTIDAIATDHAPHNIIDKEAGFEEAAFGMVGLETMLPIVLSLVQKQLLSMERMIEALTFGPASALHLEGKGRCEKGADADLVIFDPALMHTIQASSFASKSRNTPFNGLRVSGKVKWTIRQGRMTFHD